MKLSDGCRSLQSNHITEEMEVYDGGLILYIMKRMKGYRGTLMTVGPVEEE